MYDIIFVFLSTVFLTAYITRLYATKQEHVLQVNEWTKDPRMIPTISQGKHDEFVKLMNQWNGKRG